MRNRAFGLQLADTRVKYALFAMQNYLTDVWKLSFTHAAGILNIWGGILRILPVLFLFLADALVGDFKMILISSITYSVGICLVTMSTPPIFGKLTGTCKQYEPQCICFTQKVVFYTGMTLLAAGIGGQRASLKPFLGRQINKKPVRGRVARKILLGFILLPLTTIAAFFVFPYIKQWSLLFGAPGICVVFATLLFSTGWRTYNKMEPRGSPLTDVCRVFVAAALKKSQPFPAGTKLHYKKDGEGEGLNSFPPSRFLRCLDKAAIILPDVSLDDQEKNRWRLCTVEEVEAAKIVVRLVPMCTTFILCAIVSSIGNTYFVEQGSHMNRKIGKWKVPSQVLLALFFLGKLLFDKLADYLLQDSKKKYAPPGGIAVAMLFSVLCCVTAAGIEIQRLKVVKNHGLLNKPDEQVSMSAYWLFFPFFLLAGLDSFFKKSVDAFYHSECPEAMTEYYCCLFANAVSGLGFMCSVLSVYVIGKISEIGGRQNWFQYTLNKSRLDRYYWVLAALSSVNLLVFILVASCYKYKNRETNEEVVGLPEVEGQ